MKRNPSSTGGALLVWCFFRAAIGSGSLGMNKCTHKYTRKQSMQHFTAGAETNMRQRADIGLGVRGSLQGLFSDKDRTDLVGRGEGVVVLGAEVSGPRVEHLDHLSTAVDLLRFRQQIDD